MKDKKKVVAVLEMISRNTKDDAKSFDGKPLTGKIVAEYFGNHGAAIDALAKIVRLLVDELVDEPEGEAHVKEEG